MSDTLWKIIRAQEESSQALLATIADRKDVDREKIDEATRLMERAWRLVVEGMLD